MMISSTPSAVPVLDRVAARDHAAWRSARSTLFLFIASDHERASGSLLDGGSPSLTPRSSTIRPGIGPSRSRSRVSGRWALPSQPVRARRLARENTCGRRTSTPNLPEAAAGLGSARLWMASVAPSYGEDRRAWRPGRPVCRSPTAARGPGQLAPDRRRPVSRRLKGGGGVAVGYSLAGVLRTSLSCVSAFFPPGLSGAPGRSVALCVRRGLWLSSRAQWRSARPWRHRAALGAKLGDIPFSDEAR